MQKLKQMKVLLHKPSHTQAEREDNINKNRNLDVLSGQRSLLTVCLGLVVSVIGLLLGQRSLLTVCFGFAVFVTSLLGVLSRVIIAMSCFGTWVVLSMPKCFRLGTGRVQLVAWLLNVPATCRVHLRDKSVQTTARAATLRYKKQINNAISPGPSIVTPG